MDDQDYVRRAMRAYFRSGGFDQPANTSDVRCHAGRAYVLLENIRGPLAVYRITNAGGLKRLERWPKAIER